MDAFIDISDSDVHFVAAKDEDESQWVSASRTANWLRNDPLLDYFEMYQSEKPMHIPDIVKDATLKRSKTDAEPLQSVISERTVAAEKHAHAFILEQGNQFEKAVVTYIQQKFPNQIKQIAMNSKDIILESKAEETVAAMRKGIPFIYQGVLHDWDNKTFGSPDFLVRSDYLHKLVRYAPLTKEEYSKPADFGPDLNPPVDIPSTSEGFPFEDPFEGDENDNIDISKFDFADPRFSGLVEAITKMAQKRVSTRAKKRERKQAEEEVSIKKRATVKNLKKTQNIQKLRRSRHQARAKTLASDQWHYVIVDVKYSTLKMRADQIHLTNSGNMPAYKAQMYIYQRALTKLQGYEAKCAYLLGRNWSCVQKNVKMHGNGPFERLGSINFTEAKLDEHIVAKANAAVNWIRRVRAEGMFWTLHPKPSIYELYPNMSNKCDSPWHEKKKVLAEKLNEITLVWYCGVKQRKRAHDAGITEWTDPALTPEVMGFKKRKTEDEKPRLGDIIGDVLNINRDESDNPPMILPKSIQNNYRNWQHLSLLPEKMIDEVDEPIEFYVDFETVHDAAASTAKSNVDGMVRRTFGPGRKGKSGDLIFMIGVGWHETKSTPVEGKIIKTKEWQYKNFTATHMTFDAEKQMINSFYDYIQRVVNWEIERRKKIVPDFWNKIHTRMAQMAKLFRRGDATLQEVQDSQLRVNLYHWGHIEPKAYERAMERHPRERFHNKLIVENWVNFYDVMRSEPIVVRGALSFGLKAIVKGMNSNNLIDITYDDQGCANGIEAMAEAVKLYKELEESDSDVKITETEKMISIISYNEVDCKAVYRIIDYLRRNNGFVNIKRPMLERGNELEKGIEIAKKRPRDEIASEPEEEISVEIYE